MAQLMPLPFTVSYFSKIQIGFSFLVPAHSSRLVPEKGPLNAQGRLNQWAHWTRAQGHRIFFEGPQLAVVK